MLYSVVDVVMDDATDGTVYAEFCVVLHFGMEICLFKSQVIATMKQIKMGLLIASNSCHFVNRETRRMTGAGTGEEGLEQRGVHVYNVVCVQNGPPCLSIKWSCKFKLEASFVFGMLRVGI